MKNKVIFESDILRSASSAVAPWASAFVDSHCRSSSRSYTGQVCMVAFSSGSAASRFSAVWARRLPSFCGGCVVRRFWHSESGLWCWAVSIPFWSLVS